MFPLLFRRGTCRHPEQPGGPDEGQDDDYGDDVLGDGDDDVAGCGVVAAATAAPRPEHLLKGWSKNQRASRQKKEGKETDRKRETVN